ncbi:MAG: DciA family protein [Pseudomonadota bacterium]
MIKFSDADPIAEARARVALRYKRGKPAYRPQNTLGRAAAKYAKSTLPEPGSGLPRIKAAWADIVGDDIAKWCVPEKLTGKAANRTLTLRVVPQAAPIIQHKGEEIIQRLSVASATRVGKLKIVQGNLKSITPPSKRQNQPLSTSERAALEAAVAGIEEPGLRRAVLKLGESLFSMRPHAAASE